MAHPAALKFSGGAKANALALAKASFNVAAGQAIVDLEDPSAIASLATKTLVKGPKHKAPINDDTVKLVSGASNMLQRASTTCAKYELSKATKTACDRALAKVQTFERKYGREARATQKLLLAEKSAKQTLGKLAAAQKDRDFAERPSQQEPEPEDSDGEELEEDE